MTEIEVLDGRSAPSGGYKVDVSRGGHNGRVLSEWFSRLEQLEAQAFFEIVKTAADC